MNSCKWCDKECMNNRSLVSHEIRCKLNTKRIISNFVKYNRERREKGLPGHNQFTKAKREGRSIKVSAETREKISKANKNKKYSAAERKYRSKIMKQAVLDHPESYSANNVCGRTKLIEYNGYSLNGSWELLVAKYLDLNNIQWTNIINTGFTYNWDNSNHLYFPDFYLINENVYVEVKGYERERDSCKWRDFPEKLIILKLAEINLIKQSRFNIRAYIASVS